MKLKYHGPQTDRKRQQPFSAIFKFHCFTTCRSVRWEINAFRQTILGALSEVYRMASKQLRKKRWTTHPASPWPTSDTAQRIAGARHCGQAATLSCTYVPTDFYAVWCTVKRLPVSLNEFALQGVTRIAGANTIQYLHPLPESLEHLTFKSGTRARKE